MTLYYNNNTVFITFYMVYKNRTVFIPQLKI